MPPPLIQRITVDYDRRGTKEARDDLRGFTDQAGREVDGLGGRFGKLSGAVKGAFLGIGAFITGQLLGALQRVGAELFQIGSAVAETESKFRTVFGGAADDVDSFVDSFANLAGLTRTQARDFAATTGAIVQGAGAGAQASAELSESIVRLAGDLASFNNVPIDEAFQSIRSGIVGESEPLRRFGIILTEAAVQTQALADTGKAAAKDLTELEKIQARLNLIYAKAGVQVGDLARTQTSAANQARALGAAFRQQREEFASALIPAYEELIGYGTQLLNQYKEQADTLGGRLAAGIRGIVTDVITFAEQVRLLAGSIRDLSSAFDLSFLGDGSRLTIIEQAATELGRLNNVILGIQRGFVNLRLLSARLGERVGRDNSALIEQLEAENAAMLEQQVEVLTLVQRRRELSKATREGAEAAQQSAQALAQEITGPAITEATRRAVEGLQRVISEGLQLMDGSPVDQIVGDLERFNDRVTKIRNDFSQGLIDESEFKAALDRIAQAFLRTLSRLRTSLQKAGVALPADIEDAFKDAFGAVEAVLGDVGGEVADVADKLEMAADNVENIARAGRGLLNLARTFGDLSDGAREFAEGLVDAVSNVGQLIRTQQQLRASGVGLTSGAGLLAQAAPAIGIAAGLAQAIAPLLESNKRSAQEIRDLQNSIRDNERAIRENTRQLLTGQIGAGITGNQIEAAGRLISEFLSSQTRGRGGEGRGGRGRGTGQNDQQRLDEFNAFINALEDLDLEGFDADQYRTQIAAELARGVNIEVIIRQITEDIEGFIAELGGGLGTFSNDVDGAIEALRFFSRFISGDATEQFGEFTRRLLELTDDIPDDLRALLDEAATLDVSSEGGRDRLREITEIIARGLAQGTLEIGDLSPDDISAILGELIRFADGGASPTGDDVAAGNDFAANNLRAAFDSVRRLAQFMGGDLIDQFNLFVTRLLQGASSFSGDLNEVLRDVAGLDLNTQQGRDQLAAIVASVAAALDAGTFDLGDLSASDVEAILGQFQGFIEEAERGAGADEDSFTRSVQIARSITEIQANELIAISESQLFRLESIDAAAQLQLRAIQSLQGSIERSIFGRGLFASVGETAPGGMTVNVGDVSIQESDIPRVLEGIEDVLRRRTRGGLGRI